MHTHIVVLGTQVDIDCVATCKEISQLQYKSIKDSLVSNAYSFYREIWNEKKGQENPFSE